MPVRLNDETPIAAITIDGCEFLGIEDFTSDIGAYMDYMEDEIKRTIRYNPLEASLTVYFKFDRFKFYKLTGMWDWAIKNCPNKRIVHLMKYGKDLRIKIKNFYRAVHIIGLIIDRYEKGARGNEKSMYEM